MSTDYVPEAVAPELDELPGGHLLRSEVRRIVHRRFIRWLVVLGVLGYLGILVIAWTQFAKTTPELLAQGKAQLQEYADQQNVYRQDCLTQVPTGEDPDQFCGPLATAEDFGNPEDALPKQPFHVDKDLPAFGIGIGVMVACFCFLIGATSIGAEWSQKTLMALLFWEPRRLKVFATKIGVLVGGIVVLAVVAQAVMLAAGWLLGSVKGTTTVSEHFWSDLLGQQARCVLLAVFLGLIGFGIANLIRNTGAALGVGFVYFIVEIIMVNVRPTWQPWFLTTNAGALVTNDGLTLYIYTGSPTLQPDGSLSDTKTILLSNWHGGLVLGGLALALLVVGGWLFRRRDLT